MAERRGMKALELWCRRVTDGYSGVKVENMTTSWRDGLAFCAMIHHFRPDLIEFEILDKKDVYKNNELAFRTAERHLGIPALLDAEDMVEYEVPDRLSILTYLSQFYQTFGSPSGCTSPSSRTHTSSVTQMISPSSTSPSSKAGPGRLERCSSCKRPVFLAQRLIVGGKLRHRTCFVCARCGHQLNLGDCYETEAGEFVCEACPDEETSSAPPQQQEEKEEVDAPPPPQDSYSLDFETVVERPPDPSKQLFLKTLLVDDMETDGVTPALTVSDIPPDVKKEIADIINCIIEDAVHRVSGGAEAADDTRGDTSVNINRVDRDVSDIENDSAVDLSAKDEYEESTNVGTVNLTDSELLEEVASNDETQLKSDINRENEEEKTSEVLKDGAEKETECPVKNIGGEEEEEEEVNVRTVLKEVEEVQTDANVAEEKIDTSKTEEKYPDDLNPFGDDEEEEEGPISVSVVVTSPPVPAARTKHRPLINKEGKKIIEAPPLNPFWSDGEPSSDEESSKPVPAPRNSLKTPQDPRWFGSSTSLNSTGSLLSSTRRKKGPAPLPPPLQSPGSSASSASTPSGYGSRSPVATLRSRKSRPAPPPPMVKKLDFTEKNEKNYENKLKQNLSGPMLDKSEHGQWKRKKGLAPGLPVPQRRRVPPGHLVDVSRELEDLEVQQAELERQGVNVEQAIRLYEFETEVARGEQDGEEVVDSAKEQDVEGMVLQLFDIVNQKNELFRKQAELMQLRRAQRLEEEHADLEYQIRCLMGRPERNKTDSDKAQEEDLIARLVRVVERRNHIIESLDMDRKREVEEDESIQKEMERLSSKGVRLDDSEDLDHESASSKSSSSKKILKFVKKKKAKKEKDAAEKVTRVRRDADKDIDESIAEEVKIEKKKKKWFS